ncbi:cytochrome b5-related protein-like isoform X2 [Copidosoma floridanum]|uniref:cytochrome b5-related protein-like isoform X2 n=1 Tax=Copidosoma floridanum TaxID=29053 RepID=UPI0006C9C0FF|nr:cytochrome b5-related protein-like isoform X2 [Copidosoma floridanum]
MGKLKSTVPGLAYPSGRDNLLKTTFQFLEGRRKDDGAEGLWRIQDNLYDLEDFVKKHPGGAEWISMTKGTDITEAFEVHHLSEKPERLLPKFFVRKAVAPRMMAYTFDPNGFYKKFKERAREALKNVDYHNPSVKSKLIADGIATLTIASVIACAIFKSWVVLVICAHNFFHMRDNFRMYYFDLSLMSSKDWRISHVLSHHLYPNTLWDMEIYIFEPFQNWLPGTNKSALYIIWAFLFNPIAMLVACFLQGLKRYYSLLVEWKKVEFRDVVPFALPVLMSFFASSPWEAVKLWLCILSLSSFIFHFIGLTAAHHHPDIFHDGDICRQDPDWGLMELDAVRDRYVIDDSTFLALTNFGLHGLHHLLPTVDHDYLELCQQAFRDTCREFGVDIKQFSSWELIKGQYQQLARNQIKANHRGGFHIKEKCN